ncbi:uncharacterized protein LOC124911545 isoform X2 [Impatiens glandulifera]|uniref:uncharacterized protein LOC124911545 isoform X2 n=1 Tax=Impatiens glandulifera TaxID=253017 RepID=UPI001FB0C08A|nr:uncharacterized protein LOC124911545 isoform X2 [Impatiens glandulifera]
MEGNSTGSSSYRVAPGFEEKGKIEGGVKAGFNLGRGRSNGTSPLGIPGTLGFSTNTFIYPRGKLLDIYRMENFMEPSFVTILEGLEEAPPITQTTHLQPLAFVTPDEEEEAILEDVLKGKISSSGGAIYNSFQKERSNDGTKETCELESNALSSTLAEDNVNLLVDDTKEDL